VGLAAKPQHTLLVRLACISSFANSIQRPNFRQTIRCSGGTAVYCAPPGLAHSYGTILVISRGCPCRATGLDEPGTPRTYSGSREDTPRSCDHAWLAGKASSGREGARDIFLIGGCSYTITPSRLAPAPCLGRACPPAESEAFQARPTSAFWIRGAVKIEKKAFRWQAARRPMVYPWDGSPCAPSSRCSGSDEPNIQT
jgi:hypothetical protein